MAVTMKDLGIDRLSVDDRLALMHEIWDSIAAEPGCVHLSDAQRQELERRLAEHEANPGDVVPWERVKAEARAGLGRGACLSSFVGRPAASSTRRPTGMSNVAPVWGRRSWRRCNGSWMRSPQTRDATPRSSGTCVRG